VGTSAVGATSEALCLEPTAIVVVTEETLEVLMKVELPYTKALFDADAQNKFLSAVANSVQTAVGNLYIKSVVEKTSSRRVFRKLLAVAVEVEFAIRVPDTAAQAAMIANDGLTETKLNTELSKQAFLVSACVGRARCLLHLCAVRARAARRSSMRVFRLLPPAPVAPSPTTTPQPLEFSTANHAVPARGLQLFVAIVAVAVML
jgi:hypothetical protein